MPQFLHYMYISNVCLLLNFPLLRKIST